MSNESQYLSDQVQRTLNVMFVMAGHEAQGISPSELAKLVGTSPANITRVLANLKHAQFVELLPSNNSRWRLAPKFVQIANTVTINIKQAMQQLDIDQRNYSLLSH
ncbi:MAG: Rrf2 family transcriptional regulator [Gammaproteobacteria bacterium]|nr:Rrf2 family transcriptional regulator [Gammaproteobacteria bacterium]